MSSAATALHPTATTATSSFLVRGACRRMRGSSSSVSSSPMKKGTQHRRLHLRQISCAASSLKAVAEGGAQDIKSILGSFFGGGGEKKEARRTEAKEALLDAIAGTERGVKASDTRALSHTIHSFSSRFTCLLLFHLSQTPPVMVMSGDEHVRIPLACVDKPLSHDANETNRIEWNGRTVGEGDG